MRKTDTQIEFYSEILEDDIVILLEVEYVIDNDSFDHEFGTEQSGDYVRVERANVLNTNLSNDVLSEVLSSLDNCDYDEEIAENIENELKIY